MNHILKQLWVCLQYILPQKHLSRITAKLMNLPYFKKSLISWYIKYFKVDMNDALNTDLNSYTNFHEFFIRKLKPDARPIHDDPFSIVSPADGIISSLGTLNGNTLIQAKGKHYALSHLFGNNESYQTFINGQYLTIYLAPYHYHRVHMPMQGECRKMIYIKGKRFSVNQLTSLSVSNLFAINERVITVFDSPLGPFAIVFVGALIVGNIHTRWHGQVLAPDSQSFYTWSYDKGALSLNKGEEIGFFTLGSTVIFISSTPYMTFHSSLQTSSSICMGQPIAYRAQIPSSVTNPPLVQHMSIN